jgi:hypothetical protein
MTLREFYCQRWRESFREHNPFPWLFSTRGGDDGEGDRAFGILLVLTYWLFFPLWVWDWLRFERTCRREGHDWNDYFAPGKPRLFAECKRCKIEYAEAQQLD